MATDAQIAYVQEFDPLLYQAVTSNTSPAIPGTALDSAIDTAVTRLSRRTYGILFDQAVAYLAIHNLRRMNPNIGGGIIEGIAETSGGSRKKNTSKMPMGYPPDWYTTPAGEALIGLTEGSTPPSFG